MKGSCCKWGQYSKTCGRAENRYAALRALPLRGRGVQFGRTAESVQPLMCEQPLFARQAAAVAGQRSVRTDDPMARHQGGNGIAAVREPHRPRSILVADALCEFAVAPGFPIWNLRELAPNAQLKWGALHAQRQIEFTALPREVFLQLRMQGTPFQDRKSTRLNSSHT